MAEAAEYQEFIQPGNKVWAQIIDADDQVPKVIGQDGSVTYSGYQHIGTSTFIAFTIAKGRGKKLEVADVLVNAAEVKCLNRVL